MPQPSRGGADANAVRVDDRRPLPYAWSDVRGRLQAELVRLLPALGISEPIRNGLVTPRNPTRNDRRPGSFVIWAEGDAAGGWRDYATGEHGDVLDLVAYLGRLHARIDAYWWALEFLGLDRGRVRSASAAQLDGERLERDRKAAEARTEAEDRDRAARMFQTWTRLPPIGGTVAETYLREARNIDLDRLPRLPGALRFAERLEHTDDETGEVTAWPCMVAAMVRGERVTALHRTWLAPDGSAKAPVARAKKMIGSARGAAVRLHRGGSGLPPAVAAERGRSEPLMIGEGIETTLTCAAARPDYRAWAAGSLSLMGLLDWPACASAIVLLRDNDWKAEAAAAFARVEAHWRKLAAGRPVKVVASAIGSDFNDWVRA